MPTGSSAITLATTAKLEQESFDGEACRMETWAVIKKGQVILKTTPYQKLATLSTPPHKRCVHQLCTKTQLSWQNDSWWLFFFLSEINSFLPKGLAFPAEGSASLNITSAQLLPCQQYQTHHWRKCNTQWHRERIILEFSITENFPQAYLLKIKMCHKLFKGRLK